jgi:CheY-like chemotaxis protein/HPt (histidine-containing phosphotransfer) domain-containing protein
VLVGVLSEQAVEARREPASAPGAGEPSTLRILLAEDNAVNQTVALGLLQQLGYQADVAWNGREALEALERAQYDVVLMDVQMPEVDGLEASRRIRERWPIGGPHVIAMTANVMAEDREACLAAGMDDYVAKPIRPDALSEALRRVGARDGGEEAGREAGAAGLDPGALENLRQIGGDDFLVELIDAFLVDAPGQLAMLRESIEQGDAEALRRVAHTLKSNGATFGAARFADLCRDLEERAKDGRLGEVGELADHVDVEFGRLRTALEALSSRAPG